MPDLIGINIKKYNKDAYRYDFTDSVLANWKAMAYFLTVFLKCSVYIIF